MKVVYWFVALLAVVALGLLFGLLWLLSRVRVLEAALGSAEASLHTTRENLQEQEAVGTEREKLMVEDAKKREAIQEEANVRRGHIKRMASATGEEFAKQWNILMGRGE